MGGELGYVKFEYGGNGMRTPICGGSPMSYLLLLWDGWCGISRLYLETSFELCDTYHKKHIYMYQKKGNQPVSYNFHLDILILHLLLLPQPADVYINGLFASRRATLSTLAVATT